MQGQTNRGDAAYSAFSVREYDTKCFLARKRAGRRQWGDPLSQLINMADPREVDIGVYMGKVKRLMGRSVSFFN